MTPTILFPGKTFFETIFAYILKKSGFSAKFQFVKIWLLYGAITINSFKKPSVTIIDELLLLLSEKCETYLKKESFIDANVYGSRPSINPADFA